MSAAPTLYPTFRYRDARAAIEFLKGAFGFQEVAVHEGPDGTIAHAELSYGPSILMLGTDREDSYGRHAGRGWLYMAVDDADAHCAQARAPRADIGVGV